MNSTSATPVINRRPKERLLPFFITAGYYLLLQASIERQSFTAVVLKCMPIICLMYFLIIIGRGSVYSLRLLAGVAFSCVGDALLLWKRYFIYGMLWFILAHILYIKAFGLKPAKTKLGMFLFLVGAAVTCLVYRGLTGYLVIGVPLYIFVIMGMVWTAITRAQKPYRWLQIIAAIGSVFFGISDFILAMDKFVRPIPNAQIYIMFTYYIAQLCICLSILEPPY